MSAEELIARFFEFFSLIMLVVAVLTAAIVWATSRGPAARRFSEELFSWTALLAAGVVGVFTFFCHVFMPERTAANIGWATSPFQYEVGIADLATGVLGILAFWGSRGFRWAATIGIAVWLWGDAIGHIRQMVIAHNFAPGNAGPWFWTDVLVPVVLIGALWASGRSHPAIR